AYLAVHRVAPSPADADDFDLRRLQLLAEAHPDSCFSCGHVFPNLLQYRLQPSGQVTRRWRTWPSILTPDFRCAGARNAAPSHHTIPVPPRLHIPAAPPVLAGQPSLPVPRLALADGKTARQVRPTHETARDRPPAQNPLRFRGQCQPAASGSESP